jgi:DNA-binding transcriptional ArsR family regulator
MLESICGSRARAKLLGWLYSHPDNSYFVRELSSMLQEDPSNLSREMSRLETAGLLVSERRGNLKLFQADKNFPLFQELKVLAIKSENL